MWLFLVFVAVPIIEIALFIQVGGAIGLWPTLGIVILTAIAGTTLMRMQGMQTLQRLQTSLVEGRNPADPMAQGAMILVAGVLLLTPGFFTDAVGLSLLMPPVRTALIRWAASRMTATGYVYASTAGGAQTRRGAPDVIDGDYEVMDEPSRPGNNKPSGWVTDDKS
jgi:UPF0716 protein FxsA